MQKLAFKTQHLRAQRNNRLSYGVEEYIEGRTSFSNFMRVLDTICRHKRCLNKYQYRIYELDFCSDNFNNFRFSRQKA